MTPKQRKAELLYLNERVAALTLLRQEAIEAAAGFKADTERLQKEVDSLHQANDRHWAENSALKTRLRSAEQALAVLRGYIERVHEDDTARDCMVPRGNELVLKRRHSEIIKAGGVIPENGGIACQRHDYGRGDPF